MNTVGAVFVVCLFVCLFVFQALSQSSLSVGAVIYTERETRSSMNTSSPPNKVNSLFLLFVCLFVSLFVCI